jgi:UDP-glucose 4-epimerase
MSNFISGGSGFIGSHLARRIGGTIYDNYSVPNAKKENREDLGYDIKDFLILKNKMVGHDMIWHLAASGDIAIGMRNTRKDLDNNTFGTYNVLESMRLNKIDKIVFSSSATYYGKQAGLMTEEDKPAAISLYGASKVAGEQLISAYSNLFGIKGWIFRFGNVVGGGMGHGVIYDFINKLKKNPKELEVWGDGQQEKPYFLVDDCIEGMLCAVQYPPNTYNLAPMTYTKVDEIAYIVAEEMGITGIKLVHTPSPVWDAPIVQLDSSKIQRLGWKPQYTSDEAVRIATQRLLAARE